MRPAPSKKGGGGGSFRAPSGGASAGLGGSFRSPVGSSLRATHSPPPATSALGRASPPRTSSLVSQTGGRSVLSNVSHSGVPADSSATIDDATKSLPTSREHSPVTGRAVDNTATSIQTDQTMPARASGTMDSTMASIRTDRTAPPASLTYRHATPIRTTTPQPRALSPQFVSIPTVPATGPSRMAGRSATKSPTASPRSVARSVTPVAVQIGWRATLPATRQTPPTSPRNTFAAKPLVAVATALTPPGSPPKHLRQISPPHSARQITPISSPRQTSPWRATFGATPTTSASRTRTYSAQRGAGLTSPPKSPRLTAENRYRPFTPPDRVPTAVPGGSVVAPAATGAPPGGFSLAPTPGGSMVTPVGTGSSKVPARFTAAGPGPHTNTKLPNGVFGSTITGEPRFTRHNTRIIAAEPTAAKTHHEPQTSAPTTPRGFSHEDENEPAAQRVVSVLQQPVHGVHAVGSSANVQQSSRQQPNAAGQPDVRSQWDIAESRVWNVCQELLSQTVQTAAVAGVAVDPEMVQSPKDSSRTFMSKVFLAPHGVLGTQLPIGGTHAIGRSYGLVFKAPEPAEDVAILDPVYLHDIACSPPIGTSGYLGPSAGGIYEWLGTHMDPAFPAAVQLGINNTCDAKAYAYQDRCVCIHVAKPDFNEYPCSGREAVKHLATAYKNVLAEFAACDARFLRLCPISEGHAAGCFADSYPEMTFDALFAAFGQLTPEQQVVVLQAERIEMCIFRESQLDAYTSAWQASCPTRNSTTISLDSPRTYTSHKKADSSPRTSNHSSPSSSYNRPTSWGQNLQARCAELERVLNARNAHCYDLELEVQRLREQQARDERDRERSHTEMQRRMQEEREQGMTLSQQLAERESECSVMSQRAEELERELQRLTNLKEELKSSSEDYRTLSDMDHALFDMFGPQSPGSRARASVPREHSDGTTGGSFSEVPTVSADLFSEAEATGVPTLASLRNKLRERDAAAASTSARGTSNTANRARRSPRGGNSATSPTTAGATGSTRRSPGTGTADASSPSARARRPSWTDGPAPRESRGWR